MNENFTVNNISVGKMKPISSGLKPTTDRNRTQTTFQKRTNDASIKKPASRNEKDKKPVSSSGLRRRKVLSISQLLIRVQKQKQRQLNQKKRQKPIKPIIPPKSLIIILKDKPEKAIYNRRIIDYKHCGLLQRYIGLGGKILPRRQTKLTAKQQRYIAKTIKTARIMGLLPFVTKERGFFR
jgi:ribosomal protein S18